jgi:hypothetical protein
MPRLGGAWMAARRGASEARSSDGSLSRPASTLWMLAVQTRPNPWPPAEQVEGHGTAAGHVDARHSLPGPSLLVSVAANPRGCRSIDTAHGRATHLARTRVAAAWRAPTANDAPGRIGIRASSAA